MFFKNKQEQQALLANDDNSKLSNTITLLKIAGGVATTIGGLFAVLSTILYLTSDRNTDPTHKDEDGRVDKTASVAMALLFSSGFIIALGIGAFILSLCANKQKNADKDLIATRPLSYGSHNTI